MAKDSDAYEALKSKLLNADRECRKKSGHLDARRRATATLRHLVMKRQSHMQAKSAKIRSGASAQAVPEGEFTDDAVANGKFLLDQWGGSPVNVATLVASYGDNSPLLLSSAATKKARSKFVAGDAWKKYHIWYTGIAAGASGGSLG